jgi:hypothetical protein
MIKGAERWRGRHGSEESIRRREVRKINSFPATEIKEGEGKKED